MTLADQVPDGWVVKRLSEVAHITAGGDVDPLTGSPVETDFHPHPVYANAIERSAIHSYSSVARNPAGAVTITARGTLGYAVYREKPFTAIGRLLVVWPNDRFDGRFLAQYLNARVSFAVESTGVPQLTGPQAGSYEVMLPTNLPEQQAIAAALSDADGVVAGLERVIAKKRLIKQGAMQDLLTARRRLPGFSGEWEVKPFAQIARIRNTKVQTLDNTVAQNCIELEQVESETGRILYWADATNRATVKYQFEPDDVLFGRLRPYLRKFYRANIQGVCSTEIWPLMTQGINGGFLYQVIQSDGFIAAACESYGTHMPRADWGKIATHQIQVPVDRKEQEAIGEVLADMENEIQILESRLAKARAVKEGMMQNLLTGRVRLV